MADRKPVERTIAQNKKAWHDYFVDERIEAGIELCGTEVKSLRQGAVNLKDSYCSFKNGEIFALGVHISPYEKGNIFNKEPRRPRKLLLHKREIIRLASKAAEKGFSVIPLSLYFSGPRVKMEIGLCRGKKLYDKRDDMAKADAKRDMERAYKSNGREY
ncbi:MAG: SsrA-binding protein SmpB [Ruminococcaceae bacterium]|nr:SsrA-binding protein SmpB [Oscillospiraceae bacterium]